MISHLLFNLKLKNEKANQKVICFSWADIYYKLSQLIINMFSEEIW